MSFWQENSSFIKEVYETRYKSDTHCVILSNCYYLLILFEIKTPKSYHFRNSKMVEWMDNIEMAIAKVCAGKVYTSSEFKREKDNFQSLCKNLERAETKRYD